MSRPLIDFFLWGNYRKIRLRCPVHQKGPHCFTVPVKAFLQIFAFVWALISSLVLVERWYCHSSPLLPPRSPHSILPPISPSSCSAKTYLSTFLFSPGGLAAPPRACQGFRRRMETRVLSEEAWQARTRLMSPKLPMMSMASNRARVSEEVEE